MLQTKFVEKIKHAFYVQNFFQKLNLFIRESEKNMVQ